jgi:ABC-type bacteriocin/lantibiotic exporter with double-glycine peptidase domain
MAKPIKSMGRDDVRAWLRFFGYFRPHMHKIAVYAAGSCFQSALIVPVFYLVRFVFDDAIPASNIPLLVYAGVGIVAVRILGGLIGLSLRRYIVRVIKLAITDLRHDLVRQLYMLSREFHTRADLGQLHTRLVQDTERMDNVCNTIFSGILPAALSGTVIAIALFAMSWSLTLMMMVVAPAIWLMLRITGRRVRRDVHTFQRAFEAYSNGMLFVLRQIDLTRLLGHEEGELRRQDKNSDRLRLAGEDMATSFALHRQVQQNLTGIAGAIILVAGGAQVAMGAMSVGEMLAFYVAVGLLNGTANTVLGGIADVTAGTESLTALGVFFQSGPLDPYAGTRQLAFEGNISLRHVAFDHGKHAILRDVSLELKPGARIAIVGANGAGKTTLLHLLVGFVRPKSGEIRADRVSYEELDMRAFRRHIGAITQNMPFFSGTIHENITYGRPDTAFEDVIAAAKRALAHDFIVALPDGYDTQVGESGHLLSGGECQRIAIARALLSKPKLLILDEPTNHLDADTIARLTETLATLEYRPAIVLISHDPRVMGLAHETYLLERGTLLSIEGTRNVIAAVGR